MDPTSSTSGGAAHSLLTLLTEGGGRTATLALLHQHARQMTGGTCSLLFEPHPASGHMQATSGAGLDDLPVEPWHPAGREATLVAKAYARRSALHVAAFADEMPLLFDRLRTSCVILLPLVIDARRVGMLAIGTPTVAPDGAVALDQSDVPAGFLLALEVSRLRQQEAFQGDIRELLDAFAERLAVTMDLAAAVEPLCASATRLFAADRTTVWLYDRDARSLRPLASSDPVLPAEAEPVRADDPLAPAAIALRTRRPGLASNRSNPTHVLTVPLRGVRRTLGTIVFEGVRIEPGDDITLLNRAEELGRRLSSAIEATQLLRAVTDARHDVTDPRT